MNAITMPATLRKPTPDDFPDQPRKGQHGLPCTIPNVLFLLAHYGITVVYNGIRKLVEIFGGPIRRDTDLDSAFATIQSLAIQVGMSQVMVPTFLSTIAKANPRNAVLDWITSKPWDGVDRMPAFADTLKAKRDFPTQLKFAMIRKWARSAVAALSRPGFHSRGVFTLQGRQSIGKTQWVRRLITEVAMSDAYIRTGHHLDAGDKDSLTTAISHWIVEMGELDSSFKKDIARLKGFITQASDKVRRPYDRSDSAYPRQTVFCASVNEDSFLVDPTGNTRFWTIPVEAIDYMHDIDMQQLWAQMLDEVSKGEPWHLTREEEELLEAQNQGFVAVSLIRDAVLGKVNIEASPVRGKRMSASEVLKEIGIEHPSNQQARECGGILNQILGDAKMVHGVKKWQVAFGPTKPATRADIKDTIDDDDIEF